MYWLKIVMHILICSVIALTCLSSVVFANDEASSFVQLTRQANQGEISSQFKLVLMLMDKESQFYHVEEGLRQATLLARKRHKASMLLLAQHYAISSIPSFKPTKACFWYKILTQSKVDFNPYLHQFSLLNCLQGNMTTIDKLLQSDPLNHSWQKTLLKARIIELDAFDSQAKVKALQLYQQVESYHVDVSYFTSSIITQIYAPKFEGITLMGERYEQVALKMVDKPYVTSEVIENTTLKYFSLQGSDQSSLTGLGFKLNAQGNVEAITQYFTSTTRQTFTQLKNIYLDRFGDSTRNDEQVTVWDLQALTITLIKGKANIHRLVTQSSH